MGGWSCFPIEGISEGSGAEALKFLRQRGVKAAARPILGREFANAGAAPEKIKRIQKIDDAEPQVKRLFVLPDVEVLGERQVHLRIGLDALEIGEAGAQPAADDDVDACEGFVPAIGRSRRGGDQLGVVSEDIMI